MTTAQSPCERLRLELEEAVIRAGHLVKESFESGRFEAHEKQDHTIVTEADTGCERIIRQALGKEFPDVTVVSEEDEERSDLSAVDEFFLLDPIDGTWNFAARIPVFYISLAYVRAGSPRVGVLHNPISGELLSSVEGEGAFLKGCLSSSRAGSEARERVLRLRTAGYRPLSECQVHRHDRRLPADLAVRILQNVVLKARGVRDLGSTTAELALIASGRSDALVGYYVANWDVAAASLILREAGGTITNLDGTPLVLTGATKFSVCAAANSRLHRELLAATGS